jgi:hypothetical protein
MQSSGRCDALTSRAIPTENVCCADAPCLPKPATIRTSLGWHMPETTRPILSKFFPSGDTLHTLLSSSSYASHPLHTLLILFIHFSHSLHTLLILFIHFSSSIPRVLANYHSSPPTTYHRQHFAGNSSTAPTDQLAARIRYCIAHRQYQAILKRAEPAFPETTNRREASSLPTATRPASLTEHPATLQGDCWEDGMTS